MAPNLQGLNLVHSVQQNSDPHDLLSGQFHPDLAAQLDLWTHLAFDDEVAQGHDEEKHRKRNINDDDEEESTSHGNSTSESAVHDGHINVVTGTNVLPNNLGALPPSLHPTHGFDLNTFLTNFGIPPFSSLPPLSQPQPPQPNNIAPSLAQLIALHSHSGAPSFAAPLPPQPTSTPVVSTSNQTRSEDITPPAAKRHRSRKSSEAASVSSPGSPATEAPSSSKEGKEGMDVGTPVVAAAEDKRRRNTAASARFRLKKKEREAALENKAKELEARVNELERECEGLRRENGWLKGLVVGVTGAAQAPVVSGTKRPRDEE